MAIRDIAGTFVAVAPAYCTLAIPAMQSGAGLLSSALSLCATLGVLSSVSLKSLNWCHRWLARSLSPESCCTARPRFARSNIMIESGFAVVVTDFRQKLTALLIIVRGSLHQLSRG